ncbi:MAG: hypothetical protein Q4E54_06740 [Lachnospiraceae bacterium]|nr:hypothetical protein [Lachnospiraceae bacterium]
MMEKLVFKTPCGFDGNAFGCASFGFADAPDPTEKGERVFKYEVAGKIFTGRLEDLLNDIPEGSENGNRQAGIVLFGNCGGENGFIRELSKKVKCPLVGGAAACDPVSGASGLVYGGSQAAVFMIDDPTVTVSAEGRNIHGNLLGEHRIGFTNPRVLDTIDGEDALKWYTAMRAEYGFPDTDFEHMTFSDSSNVNAHMSVVDGRLVSGRDLCENMILRYVKPGDVYPQMKAFYDDPDAIVFGCAGLKGILEENLMTPGTGLFMFGEVVTINGISEFGNLMLSKLVMKKA